MIASLIFAAAAQAAPTEAPPPRPALNAEFTCRVFLENEAVETIRGSTSQVSSENGYLITRIRIESNSKALPSAEDEYAVLGQLSELSAVTESDTTRFKWGLRTPSLRNALSTTIVLGAYEKQSGTSRYVAAGLCELTHVETTL